MRREQTGKCEANCPSSIVQGLGLPAARWSESQGVVLEAVFRGPVLSLFAGGQS